MIKIATQNIKFLHVIGKIPLLRHFFIVKVDNDLRDIRNNVVLEKLFTDIYTANKTSKRTKSNRFSELDKISINYLTSNGLKTIHDIGVSNGITSVDLFKKLWIKGIDFRFFVSDKYAMLKLKKGIAQRFFDEDENFIFGYLGPFFAANRNIFFPLTVLLFQILKSLPNDREYSTNLLFYHRELLELIDSNKVENISYDVFNTIPEQRFDFVRCMNLLNLAYFSKEQIQKAVLNILSSLNDNGILLLGRTNSKGITNASFFMKENNKLVLLSDFNEGFEGKDIAIPFDLLKKP